MITSNFSGNFGNSLIQYILTRLVAEYNDYKFGFNPLFNYDYHKGYNQLDFLDLDYGEIHDATFHEMPDGIVNVWEEKYDHYSNYDFHSFQPEVFDIKDDTKLVIRCCQDRRYFKNRKIDISKWVEIKEHLKLQYHYKLLAHGIELDKNLTVINVRGGEYLGIPHVLLNKEYWNNTINHMLNKNPNMKFLVVTDDVVYAKGLFDFPVMHFGIGMDYYIIHNAKNLILSNSSFAIFPAWLNKNNPHIIAPKYWAGHNESKQWASSNMNTFTEFNFMDRNGVING